MEAGLSVLNAEELTYILGKTYIVSTKEIDSLKHLLNQNDESDIHNAQFYRKNLISLLQHSTVVFMSGSGPIKLLAS